MRETTNAVLLPRWPRVLAVGALVGFSTIVFVYLTTFVLVVLEGSLLAEGVVRTRTGMVRELVGVWGARIFFLLAVIFAASRVARRAGERPVAHGVAVGLMAACAQQGLVYLGAPPVEIGELASYLMLGAAGGWMGGADGRGALIGQEDLRRASTRIAAARSATEVAAAVGEHLGGPRCVGVAVWPAGANAGPGSGTEALASWSPSAHGGPAAERLLSRLTPEPAGMPWTVFRPGDAGAPPEEAGWERAGAGLALVVPLVAASGARRAGTLAVAFRGGRKPSRGALGLIATAASQAALALENLRLLEEGRRAGRRIGVLNERQRLAHELHDTLAQGFTSIVANLTAAEVTKRNGGAGNGPEEPYLQKARGVARESLAEVRRLIWALRPEELERRSLPEALTRMADTFSQETGADAMAEVIGDGLPLRPEVEVALLRTAQEALSNVRKHADAGRVMLTLSYMDDAVVLDVADDGGGFDPSVLRGREVGAEDRGGFGTTAMRERVERLGGSLLIESTPGEGTIVAAELPVAADEAGPTPAPPPAGAARDGS